MILLTIVLVVAPKAHVKTPKKAKNISHGIGNG
jgi:hypothetical protein